MYGRWNLILIPHKGIYLPLSRQSPVSSCKFGESRSRPSTAHYLCRKGCIARARPRTEFGSSPCSPSPPCVVADGAEGPRKALKKMPKKTRGRYREKLLDPVQNSRKKSLIKQNPLRTSFQVSLRDFPAERARATGTWGRLTRSRTYENWTENTERESSAPDSALPFTPRIRALRLIWKFLKIVRLSGAMGPVPRTDPNRRFPLLRTPFVSLIDDRKVSVNSNCPQRSSPTSKLSKPF